MGFQRVFSAYVASGPFYAEPEVYRIVPFAYRHHACGCFASIVGGYRDSRLACRHGRNKACPVYGGYARIG